MQSARTDGASRGVGTRINILPLLSASLAFCFKTEDYRTCSRASNSGWTGQLVEDFRAFSPIDPGLFQEPFCSGNALCPCARALFWTEQLQSRVAHPWSWDIGSSTAAVQTSLNMVISRRKSMAVSFLKTIPLLRIFDVEKAKEFYVDFLGFVVNWEHHFEDNSPAYM